MRYFRFLGTEKGAEYIYPFITGIIYPEIFNENRKTIVMNDFVGDFRKEWEEVTEIEYRIQKELINLQKYSIDFKFVRDSIDSFEEEKCEDNDMERNILNLRLILERYRNHLPLSGYIEMRNIIDKLRYNEDKTENRS